ncbi:hypothetical protein SDJN02_05064, partial [Cucurbita argyrosperma subsp. argyrosperma]
PAVSIPSLPPPFYLELCGNGRVAEWLAPQQFPAPTMINTCLFWLQQPTVSIKLRPWSVRADAMAEYNVKLITPDGSVRWQLP